jgi:hypothetical protein
MLDQRKLREFLDRRVVPLFRVLLCPSPRYGCPHLLPINFTLARTRQLSGNEFTQAAMCLKETILVPGPAT